MTTKNHTAGGNREQWLREAIEEINREIFGQLATRAVRVSVGFPSTRALARKSQAIAECWAPDAADDGHPQIFVSPVIDDAQAVLAALVHELVHAHTGNYGHRGSFATTATAVGLQGPMTTTSPRPFLLKRLNDIHEQLGPYPHAQLEATPPRKRQKGRMLKVECLDCGYIARVTRTWLDKAGAPLCPCNARAMVER